MTPFEDLPPHRRLVGLLEAALDCLDVAVETDDRVRVLPHWGCTQLRGMVEDLEEMLDRLERECPALGPLREDETTGDALN